MRRLESKVTTAAITAKQTQTLFFKIGLTATMIGYVIGTMAMMLMR